MLNFGFLRKFHNDNKGMSLVEMLVGIGILSVSVGPLLYMFVYTTQFNAKAKVKQRASNAASSVMETLKSYGVDGTKDRFDAGSFLAGSTATYSYSYHINPGTGLPGDNPSDASYTITGMKFSDGTETKTYNVTIELTPGTEATIDRTPLYSKYDDVLFVEDPAWTKYYDPYKVIDYLIGAGNPSGVDSKLISEVTVRRSVNVNVVDSNTVIVEYGFTGSYIYNGVTLYFMLASDGGNVNSTSSYSADAPFNYSVPRNSTLAVPELQKVLKVADNGGVLKPLRDVYLYYYPVYVNRTSDPSVAYSVKTNKDCFYFSNNYSAVNVYLFKQKDAGKMSDTRLKTEESRYELEPHKTVGLNYNINLYDAVNANLGDLSASSPNIFASVIDAGASADLILLRGLDNTDTIPLTSNVTITVTDPSPKAGGDPTLAEIRGTLLR